MAYSDVQVTFEIGHRASIRTKNTPDGFTHDWEVFVRGVDNSEISYFVEKVVFHLHETFPKPKRVLKEPPYSVKESGYAGFNLPIDIYFKNKDEPKKFKYNYDLELQTSGPPISKITKEKYTFPNPSGDLRKKLIRGGGIGVNGADGLPADKQLHADGIGPHSAKASVNAQPKLKTSSGDIAKKHKSKEYKPEEQRPDHFQQLFGLPIKTSKVSPDPKKQSPSSKVSPNLKSTKFVEKSSDKPSDVKSKHLVQREVKKEKEASKEEKREKQRDKVKDSEKKVVKAPSSPPKPLKDEPRRHDEISKEQNEESKVEKKKKDKKSREEKSKKDKHKDHEKPSSEKLGEKNKDKEIKKSPKPVPPSRDSEKIKDKEKHKEGEKDRQKHKHKKKEKEKSKKTKEDNKERDRGKKVEEKEREKNGLNQESSASSQSYKTSAPHSPSPPMCPPLAKQVSERTTTPSNQGKEKPAKNPLSTLFEELSDHESSDSNISPLSGDEEDFPEFNDSKTKDSKQESSRAKNDSKIRETSLDKGGPLKPKQKSELEKRDKVEFSKEEKRRKRKGSRSKEVEENEPVAKVIKQELKEPMAVVATAEPPLPFSDMSDQYVSELRDLQQKIMNLEDDEDLQRLVAVVTETGQYEVTKKTLDFDLCALDKTTVKRLQDFFRAL